MQIESLCHLGFVAVIPNYRLCPQISLYDGPVTDSLDCLEWVATSLPAILQKEPNAVKVDTERIVVMGHSAGASLALLVVRPLLLVDMCSLWKQTDGVVH
jgi:acetyl esterase/lipase